MTVAEVPANAKLQAFMRDTLRVLSAAMSVAGDRDRAIYWYRNTPIPLDASIFAVLPCSYHE
jgi:hypothetical protein